MGPSIMHGTDTHARNLGTGNTKKRKEKGMVSFPIKIIQYVSCCTSGGYGVLLDMGEGMSKPSRKEGISMV